MQDAKTARSGQDRGSLDQPTPERLDALLRSSYRFALSLTHDPAHAEDLVQDAWLSVLKVRGPWTTSYIFSVIRNRFIDQYRRGRLVNLEPLDHHPEGLSEDGLWSDVQFVSNSNGALDRALGKLRWEERAAMVLSAVEGYTAREIGELLGCPRGTVLSMLHRSRQKLQRWLKSD